MTLKVSEIPSDLFVYNRKTIENESLQKREHEAFSFLRIYLTFTKYVHLMKC